jgi:hypothetical protein
VARRRRRAETGAGVHCVLRGPLGGPRSNGGTAVGRVVLAGERGGIDPAGTMATALMAAPGFRAQSGTAMSRRGARPLAETTTASLVHENSAGGLVTARFDGFTGYSPKSHL